ncbi:23.2 kDa heat shock protein-like [Oryza glaberrima]|uniref:SHSP domain-containing protein n=1 Tax=Oryza barthii TaxID=65489 RepID=A0A0D3HE18_9ORYZ|nr:23.2 kDa heat shock protein-like [Oryza glaberrima]
MDQAAAAAASGSRSRVLSEIDPHSEWIHGDEFDTLVLDVTGFSKDHLKVQVEASGSLRISGERAVNGGGRHWLHFLKRFDLPPGAAGDASAIKVQLDKGVLYVQVPRPGAPAAGGGSDGEQQQQQQEGEIAGGRRRRAAARRGGHPAWQLAGALSRHRQVVLNVVIAVVLLWLVTFANKPTKNE